MLEPNIECNACGKWISSEFRYCGYCGHEVHASDSPTTPGLAERRQLTVLFCDLCSSMVLTQILDPEDMRLLIKRYQNLCQRICEEHSGYVSRYIGDGILVFFGYPNSLEDAAERAAAAALDVVSVFRQLELHRELGLREPLRLRIGIATGEVVIGDEVGEGASRQHIAVGLAPNLAARLQELAEPNSVLISDDTYELIGRSFECEDKGVQNIKNVLTPVRCWEVKNRNQELDRYESRRRGGESEFIGRKTEFEALVAVWNEVLAGGNRSLIISGSAGIGKSRLVRELLKIIISPYQYLVFQCVASRQNTVLHPFAAVSEVYLGESGYLQTKKSLSLNPVAQQSSSGVTSDGERQQYQIPLFWDGVQESTEPELASHSIEHVFTQIIARISDKPTVIVVEDIQWIDNTSLEVIRLLIESDSPVLTCLTTRETEEDKLLNSSTPLKLKLEELTELEAQQFVNSLVSNQSLPNAVKQEIVDRSGGTPLFMEEMTKAALVQAKNKAPLDGSANNIVIPLDIKDALFTRLGDDQLTRSVVQYASVIGSVFTLPYLKRILPEFVGNVETRLNTLVEQNILHQGPDQTSYVFTHALLREIAYGSLLKSDRRKAHRILARAYTEGSKEPEYADLEIIAMHFTQAGSLQQAVSYWRRAGRIAAALSANVEAVSHYRNGIALLQSLPPESEDLDLELEMQLGLASALTFTKGPGVPEVHEAYSAAIDLCQVTPVSELHFTAYFGWWRISYNFKVHQERADELIELSEELQDAELRMQAHHCQWATLFNLGDMNGCYEHLTKGMELYDAERHLNGASLYGGHDAKVCALGERGLVQWLTGDLDDSLDSVNESLEWAYESKHVGSIAHALDICLMLMVYQENFPVLKAEATKMIEFADQHGSPDHLAKGQIYRGWATAQMGDTANGFVEFMSGMELQVDIGTREDSGVFESMKAIFLSRQKNYTQALAVLNQALEEARQSGIEYYGSELMRLRAWCSYLTGEHNHDQIHEDCRQAVSIAQQFGMKSLELRAVLSLLRYESKQSMTIEQTLGEARTLLASFTQGQDSALLINASELLKTFKE
ncbi:MAG: AAA family ATPase [Gammaproteobacteria bacterium]|nr:AAA family ATPase [Gammaproteobacteria bacterium]